MIRIARLVPLCAVALLACDFGDGSTASTSGSSTALAEGVVTGVPDGTDVWIAEIFEVVGGGIMVDEPRDLTSRPGYDNQPAFGPDGTLYFVQQEGERTDIAVPALGSLDGLARWQSKLYVSSWQGALVYELRDGAFIERITGLDAPADLAIDEKRGRLLVTHYNENALSIHQL